MKLYSAPMSSSPYRVRIALHLKGVAFETVTVRLREQEQYEAAYRRINPQARVPSLELDDGTILTQSVAIIDYLELAHPEPPVFPSDPVARARALAVALAISSEIQPLNNTSVLNYLRDQLGQDQPARQAWYAHWIRTGLAAVERLIDGGHYCFGREPTIADICLVPQVFNARRYHVDISDFPKIVAVDAVATANPAFAKARPEVQPGVP
ncbi:MAG: maleylacetoacetate isomerase [Bauldia sp.]